MELPETVVNRAGNPKDWVMHSGGGAGTAPARRVPGQARAARPAAEPPAGEPAAPATGQRWFAVGRSDATDSGTAGAEAARQALTGDDARLLVVFCAGPHDPAAVLAGINAVSGGVPLVGCSTEAVISAGGAAGHGLVVAALGGPGFRAVTAAAPGASHHQRQAGVRAALPALEAPHLPHQALMLLSDGLATDQEEILAGAYSVVGASIPLVGGTAGPAVPHRPAFQLHGAEVLTDAVVGAAVGSTGPLAVGLRHGWRRVGDPMIVTRSVNGRVHTLDDRPALRAYLDRLGAPAEAYRDPVAFEAFAQSRPLGVRRRSGEEVRNVRSTEHFAKGWLASNGEIPEGGLVWVMDGDEDSVLEAAADACKDAVRGLGGLPPAGLIAFDCVGRRCLLGEAGRQREVERMAHESAGVPLAGLYTWGEIARTRGINGFHNQTLVVLAVA